MGGTTDGFHERYGPLVVVAGASEGIGAAFVRQLAARGLSVVAIARRPEPLAKVRSEVADRYGVEVRGVSLDLSDRDAATAVRDATRDLEVGLLVYNAALSPIGEFLDSDLDDALRALDVNCRTPMALCHAFGADMRARGRGGLLLMCSMAGLQGSALIAAYGATKAFDIVFGEGLWEELRHAGVDVLSFCAGATRTPNYEASTPRKLSRFAPAVMEPEDVAAEALANLGRRPSAIAGRGNRIGSFFLNRLLSRRRAVEIMARASRTLYGEPG